MTKFFTLICFCLCIGSLSAQIQRFESTEYLQNNIGNTFNVKAEIKEGAKVRDNTCPVTDALFVLKENDTALLINYYGGYWAIYYNDSFAYVSELYVVEDSSVLELKNRLVSANMFEKRTLFIVDSIRLRQEYFKKILEDTIRKLEHKKNNAEAALITYKLQEFPYLSYQNQWELLTHVDGCLQGLQYWREGKIGGEACVLTRNEYWKFFFQNRNKDVLRYLVNEIAKTNETRTHTCPFQATRVGELAVYTLQYFLKVNWYDLSNEYDIYIRENQNNMKRSMQDYLWKIIEDPILLKQMQSHWMKIIDGETK